MANTFKAGIHPPEHKELTEVLPVETLPLPKTVYIALSSHFGAPATPVVKKGDTVNEGDLIAEADGFISAPIHSPITGKVKNITKHPHVMGIPMPTIIIDRDETAAPREWKRNTRTDDLSLDDFIAIIKEKGVVGLGGAAFPTYVKFMPKKERPLETILINACECEPYVNVDYRAMLEETDRFVDGIRLIKKVTQAPRIIIGIEDNKPKAIALLSQKFIGDTDITVMGLQTKYPQGGEKMLIKAACGKEVPRGGLPLDVGIIVTNIQTVIACYQAVFYDQPILDKLITVSGKGIHQPKNIRAKLGTPFSDILDFCGGMTDAAKRLVVGGPMMGFAQPNGDAPVLKSTTGLLVLTEAEIGTPYEGACVRCGQCVLGCPMGLVPTDIAKFSKFERYDLAEKDGIMDCIECGCCVYSCSSHQPLVQLIKVGKAHIRKLKAKKG